MESDAQITVTELRLSYRYIKDHPWVLTAINGFLSAYFMEQPSFRVQRHFDELESGMHVWICEVPSTMKMTTLLRRLQTDIPPAGIVTSQQNHPLLHNMSSILLNRVDDVSWRQISNHVART